MNELTKTTVPGVPKLLYSFVFAIQKCIFKNHVLQKCVRSSKSNYQNCSR